MKDREKEISEIAAIIKSVKYEPFNQGKPTYTVGAQMQDFVFDLIAKELYHKGYRKMDEKTLHLDLGDRSAEEIKQITEAFNGEIKKQVAKEILQELFDMAKEQGKHPTATPVNWVKNVKTVAKQCGVEIEE